MKKVVKVSTPKNKFKVEAFIEKSIQLKKNQYKDVSFHIKESDLIIEYEEISAPFPSEAFITK